MAEQTSHTRPCAASLLFVLSSISFLSILAGCTSSSPRFRSKDTSDETSPSSTIETHRFSSKEVQEESMENDKTVDVASVLPSIDTSSIANPAIDRRKVMDEILAMIGTPYSFNGIDSDGIDCSGFIAKVYLNAIGKQLPHSTAAQYAISNPVENANRKFGDVLFFNTTGNGPSHVGIYLGEDLFAHASVSNGVTISSLESSYYKKRYIGARRVVK